MNRVKKFSLSMVVMVGMSMAMSSLGLAQQETIPDQFLGADEIRSTQPLGQPNDKHKAQVANARRQPKTRKHKDATKQNAGQQKNVIIARK